MKKLHILAPNNSRLEQLRLCSEIEQNHQKKLQIANDVPVQLFISPDDQNQISTSTRKTATLKYSAKKTNTDQQQRAKTVDIVRLKTGKQEIILYYFNIASSLPLNLFTIFTLI